MPLLFAVTLFTSAFLLFLIQPMVGKMILPALGGTPAVWNTCMVFFQSALLAGYAYAHAASSGLGVRRQAVVHAAVLLVPFLALPIGLAAGWAPPGDANPIPWLFALLVVSVGLPFFVVSASAPLLQKWFAGTGHRSGQDPYFLYAASNLGSMLALLCYPALIEPRFRLEDQSRLWTIGYGVLVALTLGCAFVLWRSPGARVGGEAGVPLDAPPIIGARQRIRWVVLAFLPSGLMLGVTTYLTTDISAVPLLWVIPLALYLLSFIVAFSWMPGMFYLVIVVLMPAGILALVFLQFNEPPKVFSLQPKIVLMALHLAVFFVVALACHGGLARSRPPARRLTEFYLWLSVGGVVGGLFNALVAPLAFNTVLEYPVAMVLACMAMPALGPARPGLLAYVWDCVVLLVAGGVGAVFLARQVHLCDWDGLGIRLEGPWPGLKRGWPLALLGLGAAAVLAYPFLGKVKGSWPARCLDLVLPTALGLLAVGLLLGFPTTELPASWFGQRAPQLTALFTYSVLVLLCFTFVLRPVRFGLGLAAILVATLMCKEMGPEIVYRDRSFFGVLKVTAPGEYHYLSHGTTLHGTQRFNPDADPEPLSYYHFTGPIGEVFAELTRRNDYRPVALVGLGAGTLAAYGRRGQHLDFYEIDPAVKQIASNPSFFTYLTEAGTRGVDVKVILGDARLTLGRAPDGRYGLIILDAFSSDSIPVHLITREALELYFRKLDKEGIVAFHISNRYLDLEPVLANLAGELGLVCLLNDDEDDQIAPGKDRSVWVILARDWEDFGKLAREERWLPLKGDPKVGVWTDDFSNLFGVFRW